MNQIVATVTDNGSNFVKAFQEFALHEKSPNTLLTSESSDDGEGSESETNEDVLELTNIPDPGDFIGNESVIKLPKHLRCASHTLNLIATADCSKAINSNLEVRTKHTHAIDKSRKLWSKAGKPGTAEIIREVLGCTLSAPGETRWNSYFDSISRILHEDIRPKLPSLHFT